MSSGLAWASAAATLTVLGGYEASFALYRRRRTERLARSAHAALREHWFQAVSEQPVSEVLAVQTLRYYTYASFIGGMPVGSPARRRWTAAGVLYVRRAGLLYGWALRQLILVAPAVAFVLHPVAGPPTALLVAGVLHHFDRPPTTDGTD